MFMIGDNMELLVISPEKIKIMLTAHDMEKYNLNAEDMDYNMSKTREAIKQILEIAKTRTGFCLEGERMFIQAFPCRTGGCELYISKLGNSGLTSLPQNLSADKNTTITVLFDELTDLAALCNGIKNLSAIHDDCIYYDNYKQCYILTFRVDKILDENSTPVLEAVIREFGGSVSNNSASFSSATERYSCLCGVNAIELFAKLEYKNEID